jgi:hypothetical protein
MGTTDLGMVTIARGKHRMIDARSIGARLTYDLPKEPYDGTPQQAGPDEETVVENVLEDGSATDRPVQPQPPAETPQPPVTERPPAPQPPVTEQPPAPQPAVTEQPPAPQPPVTPRTETVDVMQVARQRLVPGGPLSLELVRANGSQWSANTTCQSVATRRDQRGSYLVVNTANFRRRGRWARFSFVVRDGQVTRLGLLVANNGRWKPAPRGLFRFQRVPGANHQLGPDGLTLSCSAKVNPRPNAKGKLAATLYVRSFHIPGARALGY